MILLYLISKIQDLVLRINYEMNYMLMILGSFNLTKPYCGRKKLINLLLPLTNFETIAYLKTGNPRQKKVYKVLDGPGIMEKL